MVHTVEEDHADEGGDPKYEMPAPDDHEIEVEKDAIYTNTRPCRYYPDPFAWGSACETETFQGMKEVTSAVMGPEYIKGLPFQYEEMNHVTG